MSKLVKKGVIEPNTMIVVCGKKYYSSYSISPNHKLKLSVLHTKKELGRMWNRIQESYDTIVHKGVTYYHIDLDDRGW